MSSSAISEISIAPLPKKPRSVLLLMIDHHLGDLVLSLPIIQTLAAYFDAPADAVVDERYADLARLLPALRNVIPHRQTNRRGKRWRQGVDFVKLVTQLAGERYEMVLDICSGIQSTALATFAFARQRIGLDKTRRCWLYTRRLPALPQVHRVDRYVPFMRAIGREMPEPLTLSARPETKSKLSGKLDALFGRTPERIAIIHPGAGYAFRKWPGGRFASVADQITERWNFDVVLIGAPGEEEYLDGIAKQMRHSGKARSFVANLDEVLALFERSQILVSNESGPTHLAALTGIPIVTIFGPSDEKIWRPVRTEKVIVLRGRVCPPECKWGDCKHGLACIMELGVDRVLEAAASLLE